MELVNPCQIIIPTVLQRSIFDILQIMMFSSKRKLKIHFFYLKTWSNSLWDTGHWTFDFREKHPAKTAREPMFKFGALKVYGNVRSFFVLANIFLRWICGL